MPQFLQSLLITSAEQVDKVCNVCSEINVEIEIDMLSFGRYGYCFVFFSPTQLLLPETDLSKQIDAVCRQKRGTEFSPSSYYRPLRAQDVVSLFQSRHVALHHPPLAEYTALTHINTFIIDTSSGPLSALAYQMLKEIVQSNLKWPRGNFHNHVPISSTVNNGNAKGHCVLGWEERSDGRRGGGIIKLMPVVHC